MAGFRRGQAFRSAPPAAPDGASKGPGSGLATLSTVAVRRPFRGVDVKAEQVVVRRVGIAVAVVAALLTSACAAGQYAQSATERETTDGTSVKVGAMTLGGLALERPPNGISYDRGADVRVNLVLVNSGGRNETLTSITSPAISGWGAFGSASHAPAYPAAMAAGSSSSSSSSSAPSSGAPSSGGPTPSASSSASTATGPRPRA